MKAMLAFALVVVTMGTAGAAATPTLAGQPRWVSMRVRTVGVIQGQDVVLLEGGEPQKVLPIWIGSLEAAAIDMRLHGRKPVRPLTHDLLESSLVALKAKVERIEVIDLRDNVFIGRLTLRDASGTLQFIDARPSDLISLALGAKLPIFVAEHVLREAGIEGP
jgi:bifunctional DNase/RNase